MAISVLNTDAGLTGKTIQTLETAQLVTGEKTFVRAPNAPFAVQSGSAVVTNLDADAVDGAHYSVGTWTPGISGTGGGSGQTYTTQTGKYVKFGQFVYAWGHIVLSNKGTITSQAQVTGLPFTSEDSFQDSLVVNYFNSMTTSIIDIGGLINGTAAPLYLMTAAATGKASAVSGDLSNTTELRFTCLYRTAS